MSEWQEDEEESIVNIVKDGSHHSESETSFKSLQPLSMDHRFHWMSEKVLKFLDLDESCNLFNDLMNNHNYFYGERLLGFLNTDTYEETDLERKQVCFYKTFRDEIVQEEVSIWEEGAVGSFAAQVKSQRLVKSAPDDKRKTKSTPGKKSKKPKKTSGKKLDRDESMKTDDAIVLNNVDSPTALRSTSGGDSEEVEEFADDEDNGQLSDEVFALMMKEKSQPSLYSSAYEPTSFVPPPGEEDNYILTRKVVDRILRIPVLHCVFGEIDHSKIDLENQRLVYFVRTSDLAVPMFATREDCWSEMPRHVIAGSLLPGKFLFVMDQILQQVFLPLSKKQFRGPEAAQDKALRSALTWMMETPGIERAAETLCNLSKSQGPAFAPPSSMRSVSLLIEKMNVEKESSYWTSESDSDISRTKMHIASANDRAGDAEPSRRELLEYLSNLIESVAWTLNHVEGDNLLVIPDSLETMDLENFDAKSSQNNKSIEQLEDVVMSWEKQIKKVLDICSTKVPEGKGPLAEYTYWCEREHGLSLLVEQLNSSVVRQLLNILDNNQSAVGAGFHYFTNELNDCYAEAKENHKFLSTVLRHFKTVTTSNSFKTISNIIPSIYEHLRMIWILSKYYSTEEHMVSLLERLSWQLRQTIMQNLAITDLFENSIEHILEKTSSAHEMLKTWKDTYLSTRLDIELSGKGARWEFDQQRLFKETDYLATVSADLNDVAGVLRDFYNIFGEELKSIVDDPARIDSIIERVGQLLAPIRNAEADAFSEYNRESWDATISWFRSEVARLENEAKSFIDECFGSLINAEDALAMLIKFRNIQTRDAVQERLSMKFDLIIQQFSREIDEVEELFHKGKSAPPLLRDHPTTAGAIYWERNLLHRLDGPIKIFQTVPELEKSELKTLVSEQYGALAKQMKQFENTHFVNFISEVRRKLQKTMNKNILIFQSPKYNAAQKNMSKISTSRRRFDGESTLSRTALTTNGQDERKLKSTPTKKSSFDMKASTGFSIKTDTTLKSTAVQNEIHGKGEYSNNAKSGMSHGSTLSKNFVQRDTINAELSDGTMFVLRQIKLAVNFDSEIFNIIYESELLDNMGFSLPPFLREIGVQKRRLHMDCRVVQQMIDQYNRMIENLDDADMLLLRNMLESVEKHIQPGLTRLNWYSLGIVDYAKSCSKLLKNITSIVGQIRQTRQDLDSQIAQELGRYNLFATIDDFSQLCACKDFFFKLEKKRTELVGRMVKCYRSINPMLVKLEGFVESTATGKSPAMLHYYELYEKKIFTVFIECFLKNLKHLKNILITNKPLFYVEAALFASEVVLKPSAGDIYTIILHDVKDLMERIKNFPRWMARTCLECKSLKDDTGADLTTFSFFEDVMGVQAINEIIFSLQDVTYKLSHDCSRYLYKWKQYSNLWSLDKSLVCDKFVASNPTLQQYDEKFGFYDSIINEIDDIDSYYDVCSIRINLCQLLDDIKNHARGWKHVLASLLLAQTTQAMNELKNTIERFKSTVELVINGLERFKLVMQCISQIKSLAIQVEVEYSQFQETFRILRFHEVEFSEDDEQTAHQLQKDWESLYLSALYRSNSLESTKDQFCDMTKCEIADFEGEVAKFVARFLSEGPGSCGDDLDSGMEKMEEYGQQINEFHRKLQDLTNAELLFDLPPTDYSTFYAVKRDYEAMEELFQLYKAQKIARDTWAKTLWADLNPQQLIDGMDNYLKELRRMPKAVRGLNVGRALEASMKNFKNSVPLFVELKNEAMRERHWKELMDRTGKHFDMTPSRFSK